MTDNTEQKNKPPTTDNRADKKDSSSRASSTRPRRSLKALLRVLRIVVLLGLIVGLIAVGNFFWADWQQRGLAQQRADSAIVSLEQTIAALRQGSATVLEDHSKRLQQIETLEREIYELQLRVNTQGRRVAELGSTTRSDWLLAEAVYLTRLASQRLQTERGVKNPLALLENVDLILKELDDTDFLAVRRAVAEDITALRLTDVVDREGIYLELQAIATNLATMPLLDFPQRQGSLAEKSPPMPTEKSAVKRFFQELGSLVRIRQRQAPIEPLLMPTERAIVKHNLSMMLEQAQVALLREEQDIYRHSLSKAETYLGRFFQHNANAQTAQERLAALGQLSIVQHLPAINRSLDAMETLLVTRQQRLIETTKSSDAEITQ